MAETKPKTTGAENGAAPAITSVDDILSRAPNDLIEEIVEVPEWAGEDDEPARIKIKTLTAFERSRIRQVGMSKIDSNVGWAEMEVQQFLAAVIEPKFTEHQVRKLHNSSGAGFARVIEAHDELSSMSKEELASARKEFRE